MSQLRPSARASRFVRDIGVYAVGNIGSKLITFLLVPLYTFFITDSAEFGYYDMCMAVVFCLAPLLSLQLPNGGFRLLVECGSEHRRRAVVSFVLSALLANSLVLIAGAVVVGLFAEVRYLGYIVAFVVSFGAFDSVNELVRGLGHTRMYTAGAILSSFLLTLLAVLLVAVAGLGVPGLFITNILARFVAMVVVGCKAGIFGRYLSFRGMVRSVNAELLRYSLPLVPLVMSWWVLNSCGVFFIKSFLGLEANGVFAVVSKFTSAFYVLTFIFYQAWQQNAIMHYDSPDRNAFFSKILNNYFFLLCGLAAVYPFAVRCNYFWLVGTEYRVGAQYLFANTLVIVVFSVAAFYELGYQCSKRTGRLLPGVTAAALANIVADYLLVPLWGLYGIIAGGFIAYGVLAVYRMVDTRKYMQVEFRAASLLPAGLLIGAGVLFYSGAGVAYDCLCIAALAVCYWIAMPADLKMFMIGNLLKRKVA